MTCTQASRPAPRHDPDPDAPFREQGRKHAADLPGAEDHMQPVIARGRGRCGDGLRSTPIRCTVRHHSSRRDQATPCLMYRGPQAAGQHHDFGAAR